MRAVCADHWRGSYQEFLYQGGWRAQYPKCSEMLSTEIARSGQPSHAPLLSTKGVWSSSRVTFSPRRAVCVHETCTEAEEAEAIGTRSIRADFAPIRFATRDRSGDTFLVSCLLRTYVHSRFRCCHQSRVARFFQLSISPSPVVSRESALPSPTVSNTVVSARPSLVRSASPSLCGASAAAAVLSALPAQHAPAAAAAAVVAAAAAKLRGWRTLDNLTAPADLEETVPSWTLWAARATARAVDCI